MRQQWWKGYPWRMIQTNLRETDMLDISAVEYAKQLEAFGATVALINVGGIIASYPTELPDHFQSPFLQGDSLPEVIGACHARNIRVIARMDFSKIRLPVYERHPDWAYRRADGEIVNYNGDVHACILGGYQQEYSFQIIREVLNKLDVDGLFLNMGGFNERDYSYTHHGFCHCENCRRLFQARYGYDIPLRADMHDGAYRAYLCFKEEAAGEHRKKLVAFVRSINPHVAIDQEDFFRMESNTEFRRPLPYWQYSASSNTRALRGIAGQCAVSNTSVDFIGFFFRHVAVSAPQQKLRLWQNLANLGGLDYYLIGRLDNHLDRTAFAGVKEVFRFHKEHEQEYQNLTSVADVLVLRSDIWNAREEERGWVRALTEAHLLFDEAMASTVGGHSLDKYKAVLVAGIETLADEAVTALDAYVRCGGTLIVCGMSGRYDGRHQPRSMPCFKCLGIEKMAGGHENMLSSMLLAGDKDKAFLPSMRDTDVLMLGEDYVYAQYAGEAVRLLSLVPPHPIGPPERCYFTQVTDHPGIVLNAYGKGKGIFVPWLPGGLYYREGYENTFFFMRDVLCGIAGLRPAGEDLTEMVEVTASANGHHMLIQLVNNSGHFGTSYMRPGPVEDVKVLVPCRRRVSSAQSLLDGRDIRFEQSAGDVRLWVGSLWEFECVKLFFAQD